MPGCASTHALRTPPPQFVTTPSTQHSHTAPSQRRLRGYPHSLHISPITHHHPLRPALPHHAQPTPVARPSGV